jgi:hypothetical protein
MDRIIAGRFATKTNADIAAGLLAPYAAASDICIFHNNPPGQHDVHELGGDEDEDPGATGADTSSAATAVAAGLTAGAMGAMGGPVVALAAAAVGAYTGALVGAVDGMGKQEDQPRPADRRPGGVMLSVRIANAWNEQNVISVLRATGAMDIEQAEGTWVNGDWSDFNPVAAPRLVASQSG